VFPLPISLIVSHLHYTHAVDVEKLKSSNENQEPGIEKKNVKFLFGLLEQVIMFMKHRVNSLYNSLVIMNLHHSL
jgi:hypothetical protein